MITKYQIRAAQAMLGWSNVELAEKAKLGSATVQRARDGKPLTEANLAMLQAAFEDAGVWFERSERGVMVGFKTQIEE